MRELTYNQAALEGSAEGMRREPKIYYMASDPPPPMMREYGPSR